MPNRKLDELDRKILQNLQADGRMSLADLAVKIGLSPSPCLRRVRMLERNGVIERYVAVLDQRAVGLPVSVFVSIKLDRQRQESLDRFAKAIERWPEVLECYLMTGPRDYWLRVVVPDLDAYERFVKQKLTRLEGIASIESSFALEQVKYTNILKSAPNTRSDMSPFHTGACDWKLMRGGKAREASAPARPMPPRSRPFRLHSTLAWRWCIAREHKAGVATVLRVKAEMAG
jgi:Lrp/AsnC family transcriptional regulator, leucine-responsive regulatory protein